MGDENKPIHARVLLQFLDFNDWLRDTLVPALPETEMRKQLVSRLDVIDELSEEVLLAVDLSRNDVEDIFKLGRAGETIVWDLEFAEYCAVPNCLFPIFQEFDYIAATPRSEALTRCRVNVLLLACLAAEQRSTLEKIKSQLGPVVDMNRLSLDASDPALALPSSSSNVNISDLDSCGNDVIRLSMEMTFKLEVRYKNRKRVLIASADFILWFGSVEDMAASLVVVVADETQEVEDCEARCLAVMCKF
ncbi:hypothetical protein FQN50_007057 [Emmonsiellopsis sp. PD_5]|nr:hypothetical protein FQN50_007057 [Emmonsiellopsis sp. PD_5]